MNTTKLGNACATLAVAVGLTGFAAQAQSQNRSTANPPETTAANSGALSRATIRETQWKLKKDGLYEGQVDGIMGPKTRAALGQYQRQHNLNADGRLTRRTAESLGIAKPGAYFESAGSAIARNYSGAGGAVARGSTGMADRMKQGEVGNGFERFGKGIGHGAKDVGVGTAHAAKDVYHGTEHVIVPHHDR